MPAEALGRRLALVPGPLALVGPPRPAFHGLDDWSHTGPVREVTAVSRSRRVRPGPLRQGRCSACAASLAGWHSRSSDATAGLPPRRRVAPRPHVPAAGPHRTQDGPAPPNGGDGVAVRPRPTEAVICSAWGPDADWVRNLHAGPAVQVLLGRESYTPKHRFLSEDERLRCRRSVPQRAPVAAASAQRRTRLGRTSTTTTRSASSPAPTRSWPCDRPPVHRPERCVRVSAPPPHVGIRPDTGPDRHVHPHRQSGTARRRSVTAMTSSSATNSHGCVLAPTARGRLPAPLFPGPRRVPCSAPAWPPRRRSRRRCQGPSACRQSPPAAGGTAPNREVAG